MDELDDLATYNGDTEHDMWVDFTNHIIGKAALHQKLTMSKEYTGELGEYFDVSEVDDFIDDLDDWD